MARGTIRAPNRNVVMNRVETSRPTVVAGGAKRLLAESQERRLRSGVRNMTGRAVLSGGSVAQRLVEIDTVVATRTKILLGIFQQRRVIGAVGVVTGRAGPNFWMNVGRLQVNRVAVQAKLRFVFFEPQYTD